MAEVAVGRRHAATTGLDPERQRPRGCRRSPRDPRGRHVPRHEPGARWAERPCRARGPSPGPGRRWAAHPRPGLAVDLVGGDPGEHVDELGVGPSGSRRVAASGMIAHARGSASAWSTPNRVYIARPAARRSPRARNDAIASSSAAAASWFRPSSYTAWPNRARIAGLASWPGGASARARSRLATADAPSRYIAFSPASTRKRRAGSWSSATRSACPRPFARSRAVA